MIILKILLGILLLVVGLISLVLFCKICIEGEYNGSIYQVKIKFLGITLFREYTDKEITKLLKKVGRKAKKATEEVLREVDLQPEQEFSKQYSDKASHGRKNENEEMQTSKVEHIETVKKIDKEQKEDKSQYGSHGNESEKKNQKSEIDSKEETIFEKIRGIRQLIKFGKESLSKTSKYFLRKIIVEHLRIELAVANEDRAVTAQLFGYINALVANIINYLARYMPVRKVRVNIYPEFASTSFSGFVEAGISFRGINGLITALFLYLDYRKFIKKEPEEDEKNGEHSK